jgi:hypothetical protein
VFAANQSKSYKAKASPARNIPASTTEYNRSSSCCAKDLLKVLHIVSHKTTLCRNFNFTWHGDNHGFHFLLVSNSSSTDDLEAPIDGGAGWLVIPLVFFFFWNGVIGDFTTQAFSMM